VNVGKFLDGLMGLLGVAVVGSSCKEWLGKEKDEVKDRTSQRPEKERV
jgi:hypothetical protein